MKDHLTSALAQLNGSADWNKRTGGTLPAKLTCFEAQDVLTALQELQQRAERAEAELAKLRALARAIEPFASELACNRSEMKIYDACRAIRPLVYNEPVSENDAASIIGRTAKRGGWNK